MRIHQEGSRLLNPYSVVGPPAMVFCSSFKLVLGPLVLPRSPFDAPSLPCIWRENFKRTHEGHNRVNEHWAVLKTKSEGLHFHSHTERKCVFWSLMLLYSEGLVTLYRLIHGQSLILISEIFMDTARLRPKAGMSAPDIRISVPI